MNTKRNLIQMCLLYAIFLHAINGGAQPVTKITAGGGHSLFLKGDGSLWAMGYNDHGQLGDGTYDSYTVPYHATTKWPEQIIACNVTAITAGNAHSLFLKSDGSLWATGDNEHGQLGDGTNITTNRPLQILSTNVVAMAAGTSHSLFLGSSGSRVGGF